MKNLYTPEEMAREIKAAVLRRRDSIEANKRRRSLTPAQRAMAHAELTRSAEILAAAYVSFCEVHFIDAGKRP